MSSVEMKTGQFILLCDMTDACLNAPTYIDDKGYIYCEGHGKDRQCSHRCRKLRPHELNRLRRGQTVERF
jgi:hypothetical protein